MPAAQNSIVTFCHNLALGATRITLLVGLIVTCFGESRLLAQPIKSSRREISVCQGDTVRLSGPPGYVTYDWMPQRLGQRRAADFSFVATTEVQVIVRSEPLLGDNSITNYDFDLGFLGFRTDYTPATAEDKPPGSVAVLTATSDFDASWRNCPDITRNNGLGRMLMVRGVGRPTNTAIYRLRVLVERDSSYVFTFSGTSLGAQSPVPGAGIVGYIDGNSIGPVLDLPTTHCTWRQFLGIYTAPRSDSVELAIVETSQTAGRGFAIDNVLFARRPPTRIDTIDVRIVAVDSTWFYVADLCPDSLYVGTHFSTSSDTVHCTRVLRPGRCDSVFCESVRYLRRPTISITVTDPTCAARADGNIALDLDPSLAPWQVKWTDTAALGLTNRSNLDAGVYSVRLVDQRACPTERSVEIRSLEPLRWDTLLATADCAAPGLAQVTSRASGGRGTGSYGFRQNQEDLTNTGLNPSTPVEVSYDEGKGCRLDTTLILSDLELDFRLNIDSTVNASRDSIKFEHRYRGQGTATWTLNGQVIAQEQRVCLPLNTRGVLRLEVRETLGCVWRDSLRLETPTRPERLCCPSAFSPNGDGINDWFVPAARPEWVQIKSFQVFDRWGALHLSVQNCSATSSGGFGESCAWNGNSPTGEQLAAGSYVYYLQLLRSDGGIEDFTGGVTLLR